MSVWVHSNLEEVELFLNGRSQGRQKVQPLTHLQWQVKYEPGAIEAHGIKGGKVVMTSRRETTGAPATIRLSADRSESPRMARISPSCAWSSSTAQAEHCRRQTI